MPISFGAVSEDFSNLSALKKLTIQNTGLTRLQGAHKLANLEYMQVLGFLLKACNSTLIMFVCNKGCSRIVAALSR